MNRADTAAAPGITRSGRFAPPTLFFYVLRELVVPTAMGFGLFTFVLLMHFLLQLAEMIISLGVGAADVGRLFLYSVPHIIVLTVPIAVLVGGLIAFGRLSADSEVIAMRSGGVSLYQLAVPVLTLGVATLALNTYLCLEILPWGNNQIRQLQWRLINSRTISNEIRPRVFETSFSNFTLLVEDIPGQGDVWHNLLLVQTLQNPPRIIMAETAAPSYDEERRALWLILTNGYIYEGSETAESSSVMAFEGQEELIRDESGWEVGELAKDERSMKLSELNDEIERLESQGLPTAVYSVEVHKKFAIPLACVVMALISLPLGISTQRHTKATGFLVAIGVIAVYYQLIENGEKFAEEGVIPAWLGIWTADVVIGLTALFLLWAKAREKDFGIVDTGGRGLDWLRGKALGAWKRLRNEPTPIERAGHGDDETVRARPLRGRRFPRILDRYVVSQFCRIFVLALFALVVIWIIAEYFEISDDIYQAGAGRDVVWRYFKFQLPFIVVMSLPIATILGVLIAFSLMSKQNEVVAVLAGGTSLFRFAAPVIVPVVALTAIEYGISDYVMPYTNLQVVEIKESIRPGATTTSFSPAQGHWSRGRGRHIFNYADYDSDENAFQGLYVYYLDEAKWRLSRVEYWDRVGWQEDHWQGSDGWTRHYVYGDDGSHYSPPLMRFPQMPLQIVEPPAYFDTEERLPAQMSAYELRHHIEELEERGFDASQYRVDLHQKLAFPAVVFVLALVGIPFGFRMGRQGTLSGIGVGLALAFFFWLTFGVFQAVGTAGILPPALAAWAPHLLFLALAGYVTLGLRT